MSKILSISSSATVVLTVHFDDLPIEYSYTNVKQKLELYLIHYFDAGAVDATFDLVGRVLSVNVYNAKKTSISTAKLTAYMVRAKEIPQ